MGGLSMRPSRAIPLVIARLISESVHAPIPAFGCDVMFGAVDFSQLPKNQNRNPNSLNGKRKR